MRADIVYCREMLLVANLDTWWHGLGRSIPSAENKWRWKHRLGRTINILLLFSHMHGANEFSSLFSYASIRRPTKTFSYARSIL